MLIQILRQSIALVLIFSFSLLNVSAVSAESGTVFISNCDELQKMQNNLFASYKLVNDIDCSDTVNWNDGTGFMPVGNSPLPFRGNLDGNHKKIINLYISQKNSLAVGLFGQTNYARVQNIGLQNANISGHSAVGGLIGLSMFSNVKNSYVSGKIEGSLSNMAHSFGGLVGVMAYHDTIEESYSNASISGNVHIGGIVGSLEGYGDILNSYSSGTLKGNSSIGGLIGRISSGLLSSSYSYVTTSTNEGSSYMKSIGGLIGTKSGGVIKNSYWNKEISAINTMCGDETGKHLSCNNAHGLKTGALKQQQTFQDWDFANIWGLHKSISFPWLQWQYDLANLDINADGAINESDLKCAIQVIHHQNTNFVAPGCLSPEIPANEIDYNCDGSYSYADIKIMKALAYKRPLLAVVDSNKNLTVDACEK